MYLISGTDPSAVWPSSVPHVYSLQSSPPQWCRQPTLRNKSPHIPSVQYPGCQQPVGPVCTNNTPVFRLGAAWLGAAWPRLVCFKSLNGKLITAANMCSAVATTHHQDMWHGRRSSGGNAMLHHPPSIYSQSSQTLAALNGKQPKRINAKNLLLLTHYLAACACIPTVQANVAIS